MKHECFITGTCEQDGVCFGKLEQNGRLGVFMHSDYISDLNQFVQKVKRNIELGGADEIQVSVRNLIGMIYRLLVQHASVCCEGILNAKTGVHALSETV